MPNREGEPIRFGLGRTSIAALLVAVGPAGVVAIIISEHPDADAEIAELRRRFPRARLVRDDEGIKSEITAVIDFVEAPKGNIKLPLDIRGTDFQRRAYQEVLAVPFGQTTTFADIAARIGSPRGVRARWAMPARETRSSSRFRATGCFAATAPGRAAARGAIGASAPLSPAKRLPRGRPIAKQTRR
jgi:O6-methylguanine-DNA--protein-cysteine methyltransferase